MPRSPRMRLWGTCQEPPLTEGKTVLQNVEEGVADIKALQSRMDELGVAMGDPDADFDTLMAEMGGPDRARSSKCVISTLSSSRPWTHALPAARRHGRCSLAANAAGSRSASLLQQPDLLLLDEPTNHLDAESAVVEMHPAYPGAVLAATHDRTSWTTWRWILELDRGRTYPYEGNYSTYLDKEGSASDRGSAMPSGQRSWSANWSGYGQTPRRGRPRTGRGWLAMRSGVRSERSRKLDFEEINILPGPRLGSNVLQVRQLVKGFGDRLLFNGPQLLAPRAGIVGVVGPNGVGKSTLFG